MAFNCYCGSFGCLETIASYPALFEEFQTQVKLNGKERFFDIIDGELSCNKVKRIMEEANCGEKIAVQVIRNIGSYIGVAIANLLGTINPDLIILGGRLY